MALSCPGWVPAQSIEPDPGVVEVGGEVEIRAWSVGGAPLPDLEIGLRRLSERGRPEGELIDGCTTDEHGVARIVVERPVGRYRLEAKVDAVAVESPFRVVPAAPRIGWAVFGGAAVLIALFAALGLRRRGLRSSAPADGAGG